MKHIEAFDFSKYDQTIKSHMRSAESENVSQIKDADQTYKK